MSTRAMKEVLSNTALRQARTCYDHLAGVVGVHLLEEMLLREWLTKLEGAGNRPVYALTAKGSQALAARQVAFMSSGRSTRMFACGCPDWTEDRPHLAGKLGSLILVALEAQGFVGRQKGTRAVQILKNLDEWFEDP